MHITIPITPITKKNHQQIIKAKGHYMVIPSKQYRQYEKDCGAFLNPLPFTCIEQPVNVKCLFYMPTRRRVDLVNLEESICDVLVKYGILADDNSNIVASMDGSRVLYDKENSRTEIEIELL
jgi:Holliday junction resolvase RusA-like endonuclease